MLTLVAQPEMGTVLFLIGVLVVIGAIAGVIAGLLGVGGGIVLVPAFYYTFSSLGYDSPRLMQICVATSLATIVVTSIRSVLAHNRRGAVDWDILKGFAPGIVAGALLGLATASALRSRELMVIFGVIGVLIGLYLGFGRIRWKLGDQPPRGLARIVLSVITGFFSVLMGIGGGSFGVPILTLYGVPIHRAVATAAGFGAIIAIPSVIGFLALSVPPEWRPPFTIGHVNIAAFAIVVTMTTLTAPIGVRIAHAMDPKPLRRAFAIFIILMALNMLRKALMG